MSVELLAKAKKTRPGGDSTAKLLLIVLADYANAEGMAWPTVATMTEEVEKSERTIQTALRKLERLKLIRRGNQKWTRNYPKGQRPTVYEILPEKTKRAQHSKTARVQSTAPVETTPDTGAVHNTPTGAVHDTTPVKHTAGEGCSTAYRTGAAHCTQTLKEPPMEPLRESTRAQTTKTTTTDRAQALADWKPNLDHHDLADDLKLDVDYEAGKSGIVCSPMPRFPRISTRRSICGSSAGPSSVSAAGRPRRRRPASTRGRAGTPMRSSTGSASAATTPTPPAVSPSGSSAATHRRRSWTTCWRCETTSGGRRHEPDHRGDHPARPGGAGRVYRRTKMSQPSRLTCQLVDLRDETSCVRCGAYLVGRPASRHHRKRRSQASRAEVHSPANLIDLCGTGTTGCHGWVHAHPEEAREHGWLLRSTDSPKRTPMLHALYGWVLLDDQGHVEIIEANERKALI